MTDDELREQFQQLNDSIRALAVKVDALSVQPKKRGPKPKQDELGDWGVPAEIKKVFTYWNNQKGLISHKFITQKAEAKLRALFNKGVTTADICQAIANYAEIVTGEDYYFKYRWTFEDFLGRGLDKFSDINACRINYRKQTDPNKPDPKGDDGGECVIFRRGGD